MSSAPAIAPWLGAVLAAGLAGFATYSVRVWADQLRYAAEERLGLRPVVRLNLTANQIMIGFDDGWPCGHR